MTPKSAKCEVRDPEVRSDALIAATAIELQLPVLNANVKHFSAVASVTIEAFAP
ncbi:MAG: hypothetical protein J0L58_15420 [Burkholderiales bacterium]|nr:hypothetical protein [Burkholderiales bacterium]